MELKEFRALFRLHNESLVVSEKALSEPYSWWVDRNGGAIFTIWSNDDVGIGRGLAVWGLCGGMTWGDKEQEMAAWEADLEAKEIARSLGQEEKKKKARSL